MPPADIPTDPAIADRCWVGYHPFAMAPVVVVLAVVSVVVWTGRWYLDDLSHFVDLVGEWTTFAIAWGAWPAVLLVFLYRTVTFTYRLTERAVFLDYGPLFGPVAPIPLTKLDAAVAGGNWLARRLGVGHVELRSGDGVLRLKGVRRPDTFVEQVRAARAAARTPD